MLESHLEEGNQKLISGQKDSLKYGVSITDACIGWNETEEVILNLSNNLSISQHYSDNF